MRFYYSLTLSTFILLYLLSDNVLGRPTKGRYSWLECKPGMENANCVQQNGPWMDLPGPVQRIPAKDLKEISADKSSEESPEIEDSGDGSGADSLFESNRKERASGPWVEQSQNEVDGSGFGGFGGFDPSYSNYLVSEPEKLKLSAEDLREDNMIE